MTSRQQNIPRPSNSTNGRGSVVKLKPAKVERQKLSDRSVGGITALTADGDVYMTCPDTRTVPSKPTRHEFRSRTSLLHERAVGTSRSLRPSTFQKAAQFSLSPSLSFTGTSGDVNSVAWAPNGRFFAAGSAALTDSHSMQYNLPNNLLLGDVDNKALRELPHHHISRPRTSTGANASLEMYNSQDPILFTTISSVDFSPDGRIMFSAGYDNTARIWDIREGLSKAVWLHGWLHKAPIDTLAVGGAGLFATGAQRSNGNCIKVMRYGFEIPKADLGPVAHFTSHRGTRESNSQIVPSSMKWGPSLYGQDKYLLVGFSSNAQDYGAGEACLWDLNVWEGNQRKPKEIVSFNTRNVFDVAWSPSIYGRFAIGCTAGSSVNRGIRSVVRIHDSQLTGNGLRTNQHCTIELECPALDMNDVVFNPSDEYIVSAGCTDGASYVWDLRNPHRLLHRFAHGPALLELDDSQPREHIDTGIRFLSWGQSGRELYTGSSDGVVCLWNPYLSTEDAYVDDVVRAKSGIMSGAFSPDFFNLLLGEVNGTISVHSAGARDCETFTLQHADRPSNSVKESGIAEAARLLQSSQMKLKPFGDLPFRQAVQGVNYAQTGFIDSSEDAPQLRKAAAEMQRRFRPRSPCTLDHSFPALTEEEQGDSGAWKSRIPDAVRHREGRSKQEGIECFRCQQPISPIEIDAVVDELICYTCNVAWRVDVLGYTSKERRLDRVWRPPKDNEDTIETHYSSLWQDRPASPL